jgi:hypothetical protein
VDSLHHLLLRAANRIQSLGWEAPWLAARSSSSPFTAPKANPSPSTRSRQRGETILLTYGNRDGRGKADDGEVARVNLGDGEGDLQGFSGDENSSYGGGGSWGSSSGQLIDAGGNATLGQRWWIATRVVGLFRAQRGAGGCVYIGGGYRYAAQGL